ncbi:MAG: ribose-phosphate diphosphokinase [Armatimonadota bacterium]|nr:ribose-phosphate diphosphokinase [bacterium]MDW8319981.1 ribose-phosphate diphosphokinase [Armatimonadota bacterium]
MCRPRFHRFMRQRRPLKLFAGNGNPELARRIASELRVSLGSLMVHRFSDGEVRVECHETVRGCDVFVVQSLCPPVQDNLMELLILLDALRRASAARLTVVVPYYAYARQEKKHTPRDPVPAKVVADMLTTAGAHRVITMDLHAEAITGFFHIPVDDLSAISLLTQHFTRWEVENLVIVAPDAGAVRLARAVAQKLGAPLAVAYARAGRTENPTHIRFAGDVQNLKPLIVEDMIVTGKRVESCVKALIRQGCVPEIRVAATHGVLAGNALQRVMQPQVVELAITDTIPSLSSIPA